MKDYIGILRGINVGKHQRLKMADLVISLEKDGLRNVETYIQSGNVRFGSSMLETDVLEKVVSKRILNDFNYEVSVFIKTEECIDTIISDSPFSEHETKLKHFTFISSLDKKYLDGQIYEMDDALYKYHNDGVYLYIKGAYHKSKLSNSYFEKLHNSTTTTRNWKTMLKIRDMISNH